MGDGIHINDAWVPTRPPKTNGTDNRSREAYIAVQAQFDLEHNERYTPRGGNTFCNIALWDISKAMGAVIPHWVNKNLTPAEMGAQGSHELNANDAADWLAYEGWNEGWVRCTPQHAKERAERGLPTAVVWNNRPNTGHVAMVVPRPDDAPPMTDGKEPNWWDDIYITQAGATNFSRGKLTRGFGNDPARMRALCFYTHD